MRVNTLWLFTTLRVMYSQRVESTGNEPEAVPRTEEPNAVRYDAEDSYYRDDDGMLLVH